MKTPGKRILSIRITTLSDDSPDTSWLGEYSGRRTSEYSIDRAHDEDCPLFTSQADYTNTHDWSEAEGRCLNCDADNCSELCPEFECGCGDWHGREYRYFNPSFNYVDKSGHALPGNAPEDVRKYTLQDYERMERLYRGDWGFIGIQASAKIQTGSVRGVTSLGSEVHTVQTITSGGLWGIESDSDADYIRSVENDELAELRTELHSLGFSSRAIAAAMKDVIRETR